MQCRACRTSSCEEVTHMSYVVPTDGKTLYDYFNDCTQLNSTNRDNLPQILCRNCTQNLQQAYNFRKEARSWNEELRRALVFAKNEAVLVCDSAANQSDILEDGGSTFRLLAMSPKRATSFHYFPEISNVLQDIEGTAFDQQSGTTKNEPAGVRDHSEQSEVIEDININFPMDPLSVSFNSGKPSSTLSEDLFELNILKEEIKLELSSDLIEQSNTDQLNESVCDGQNESSNISELKRKITCYACDYCSYKCSKQTQLKDHIFERHKDTIICRKCCKVFELPKEMQLHNQLVHDISSPMCCPWCENSSPIPKKVLAKHLQKKHNDTFLKFFPRVRILQRAENDPYPCERCKKKFESMDELASHIHEHTYDCPLCDMKFKKKATHHSHVKRIHNQSLSSLKTMLTDSEGQHIQSKHNGSISKSQNDISAMDQQSAVDEDASGQKTCLNEDEEESELESLDEYVELVKCKSKAASKMEKQERRLANKSIAPRKYICSYCPREFMKQKSVRLHEQKVHLCKKVAQEKCPICQKDVNATYIKDHIANVHNAERKLACDICGDLFKNNKLLFHHKQLHMDRKHPCTVCDKRYICASELKVHMRMHTGETPYQCHLCDQRFKIRGALNYHLQQHAGVKRKCEVCGKEFNRIEKLKAHSYTHTGFPYRCYMCDYQNVKREAFRKHLLEKHGTSITVDELLAMFKANTGRWPRVRVVNKPT